MVGVALPAKRKTNIQNKKALPGPLSRGRVKFIRHLSRTDYKHNTVFDVLHLIKGRKCSDERDYLYEVLGLFPPEFQKAIMPSHKLTAAEVYTNLVISYLKQQKDLNILRDYQLDGSNKGHRLPSWVPDLSSTEQWTNPIPWQNAAGRSSAVFHFIDSQNLEVNGRAFATVDFAEDLGPHHTDTRVQNILRLFGIQEIVPENVCIEGDSVALEKFCNTLAGGYLRDRFPDEVLPLLQTWKTEAANAQYLHKLIECNPHDDLLSFHDQWVSGLIQKRVFFKTCTGSIGLGPSGLQEGSPPHSSCNASYIYN